MFQLIKIHFLFSSRKLFQDGQNPMFNSILLHLGFSLPENWETDSVIQFPDAEYDLIKCVISLIDALMGTYLFTVDFTN